MEIKLFGADGCPVCLPVIQIRRRAGPGGKKHSGQIEKVRQGTN